MDQSNDKQRISYDTRKKAEINLASSEAKEIYSGLLHDVT